MSVSCFEASVELTDFLSINLLLELSFVVSTSVFNCVAEVRFPVLLFGMSLSNWVLV